MAKLTREQRIEIYELRKKGESISNLSRIYKTGEDKIHYLIRLIDMHGYDVLRKDKNNYYSPNFKQEVIDRVLIQNESVISVSIEYGFTSTGILFNWIRKYKEMGYNVIEHKRGRATTMTKKPIKNYEEMTAEEKVKFLEDKTLYLEAENAYLKKLKTLMQLEEQKQKRSK